MKLKCFRIDLNKRSPWLGIGIEYHIKGKLLNVWLGHYVLTIWKKYEK